MWSIFLIVNNTFLTNITFIGSCGRGVWVGAVSTDLKSRKYGLNLKTCELQGHSIGRSLAGLPFDKAGPWPVYRGFWWMGKRSSSLQQMQLCARTQALSLMSRLQTGFLLPLTPSTTHLQDGVILRLWEKIPLVVCSFISHSSELSIWR